MVSFKLSKDMQKDVFRIMLFVACGLIRRSNQNFQEQTLWGQNAACEICGIHSKNIAQKFAKLIFDRHLW